MSNVRLHGRSGVTIPRARLRALRGAVVVDTITMRITFDPIKRARTLADRGLDFEDAAIVFDGVTVEVEDLRKNYGERRIICHGLLSGRLVVVGYTPSGHNSPHIQHAKGKRS
jgi:uncharacterized protein